MKPYYSHAGITIYHGDCHDIAPRIEQPDLLLTDPPYGMNFRSNHRAVRHDSIVGDESLPVDLIRWLIGRSDVASYVFCRWNNLSEMPTPRSVLAWVKNNWSMGDLEHEHGRQWEAICFYPGPRHAFIKRIPDVIYADRTGNALHPTEKPESLLKRLIQATDGVTSIFDPFMGSGTTLVAAKECGIAAIGIEIEEKYCEIAAKRLSQEVLRFD